MRNYRPLFKKLQRAILNKGLKVKISTDQFYSDDQKRYITMYTLSTPISELRCDGSLKNTHLTILRTASQPDICITMADIYKAVS